MSRLAARVVSAVIATLFVAAGPALAQTGDPLRAEQWNLDSVKVDSIRSYGRGSGAVVSVVSTGIDLDHPDLVGQTVGGRNFIAEDTPPDDDRGLGTHISGVVAALTDNAEGVASIAPETKIMPVKTLDRMGNGQATTFLTGLRYAGEPVDGIPIKVVLFTLPLNWDPNFNDSLQFTITDIVARGVLVVTGATPTDHFGDAPVMRVAGLDQNDARTLDSGSPTATFGISAPGDAIVSTWFRQVLQSDYREQSGIDQAAAHVAAAGAILMGKGLNVGQAAAVLLSSARDLGDPGPDATYGHGALDLAAAAQLAAKPPPPTTPTTTKKPTDTTAPPAGGGGPSPSRPAPSAPTTLGPGSPPRADAPNPFSGAEQPAELPANALELQDDSDEDGDRPWGLLAVALAGLFLSFGGLSRTMLKLATAPAE